MLLLGALELSSCMAPNCPIKSCHVRKEHRHGKIYRGVAFGQLHNPIWWLSNRRDEGVAASGIAKKDSKAKKPKFKKLMEWESQ